MVRGASIDGRATRPRFILCDMRSDLEFPACGAEAASLVTLVGGQCDAAPGRQPFIGHRDGGAPRSKFRPAQEDGDRFEVDLGAVGITNLLLEVRIIVA
jgi:hypothetical protein